MNADAFERFEKSRSGLLIPVAVFVIGAVGTVVAMLAVESVVRAEGAAQQKDPRPAATDPRQAPEALAEPIDPAMAQPQIPDQGPLVP